MSETRPTERPERRCALCSRRLVYVERFTIDSKDLSSAGLFLFASGVVGEYVWYRCPNGHESVFERVQAPHDPL